MIDNELPKRGALPARESVSAEQSDQATDTDHGLIRDKSVIQAALSGLTEQVVEPPAEPDQTTLQ